MATCGMTMPPISEADFLRQVTDLADLYGWRWVHFRPAQTLRGWRTPVSGPLGKGWPDLVLVKPERGVIFAELKGDKGRPTPEQAEVLRWLHLTGVGTCVSAYVWRPRDFDEVVRVLSK